MKRIGLSIMAMAVAAASMAQNVDLDRVFSWNAELSKTEVSQGGSADIVFTLDIEDSYFTYREQTSFKVEAPGGVTAGEPSFPPSINKVDPTDGQQKEIYEGKAEYRIPLSIADDAPAGEHTVTVTVGYQGCSQTVCYFPQRKTFELTLTVAESGGAPPAEAERPSGGGFSLNGGDVDMDRVFSWSAALSQTDVSQGASAYIDLTLDIEDSYFTYRGQTSFKVEAPGGVNAAEPLFPPAKDKVDPTDGQTKAIYEGTQKYRIPISIAGDAPTGEHTIKVTANYQGCSQTVCYFPQRKTFELALNITEGSGVTPPGGENAEAAGGIGETGAGSAGEDSLFSGGLLATLAGVFIAGVFTSFTPCVYPLIPITVTIFGARESESKLQGFLLASTYVLGLALMYSALGFAAARTGAVFGQYMSNPWVLGGIAALFIAMGASMLGAFELQLPSSWQAKLSQVGGKGHLSAFLMGIVGGVIAAPCTGPVLVGILAYVATAGNPAYGFALLLTYALGLGLLFLAIGTFSGFISKLPKSGGWMEHVKSVFGIVLFAFALYYLKDAVDILKAPLNHSAVTYGIAFAVMAAGVALGAVHLSFHSPNLWVKAKKGAGVALCVGALYVGIGSLTAVQAKDVAWVENLEEGLAMAESQNKPVMIDFWAEWCAVCKEIEAYTFADPEVGAELKRFVTIKVDLTESNEANAAIQEEYDIKGLPLIYFYNSDGERLPGKSITGFINAEDFLNHIEDIQ